MKLAVVEGSSIEVIPCPDFNSTVVLNSSKYIGADSVLHAFSPWSIDGLYLTVITFEIRISDISQVIFHPSSAEFLRYCKTGNFITPRAIIIVAMVYILLLKRAYYSLNMV